MRIKYKVWSLVTIIISTIVCADIYFGYKASNLPFIQSSNGMLKTLDH